MSNVSGQAGGVRNVVGGSDFGGDIGGPGQQRGTPVPDPPGRPTNQDGNVTNNPSGDGVAPAQESVFGDLGGGGQAAQTGGPAIPNGPGRDPGGQGGPYG
jgi:hypothetical protein